jgi:hypothetical protein
MSRKEFSNSVKRDAWNRAEGICEAQGLWYGFPDGVRCTNRLELGVEYDHHILAANSGPDGATLENCRCVCKKCHRWKTTKRDVPLAAKTKRQQDKFRGIKRAKRAFPKRVNPWGYKFTAQA